MIVLSFSSALYIPISRIFQYCRETVDQTEFKGSLLTAIQSVTFSDFVRI